MTAWKGEDEAKIGRFHRNAGKNLKKAQKTVMLGM